MACPELSGYHWRHSYCFDRADHGDDQRLFRRIVFASIRTKRPPLCAPDVFFYDSDAKAFEVRSLFVLRGNIPGIRWNLGLQTKRMSDHVDWPRFVDYIRNELPTGEFLFCPSEWSMLAAFKDEHKKNTPWDKVLFARSVVEIAGHTNTVKVRQETFDFVSALGYDITLPRKSPLKRKWSQGDRDTIYKACYLYWI
jgi:hypothetical protein